jgi:Holliday junction resolvase RusA-like endonuclease
MNTVNIKPLSVNQAWQGRRFKTPAYRSYEKAVLILLPKIAVPEGKLSLSIDVGYSNKNADIDNAIKPMVDIMQKKYGFNDSRIYEMHVRKIIVDKGKEYFKFNFSEMTI